MEIARISIKSTTYDVTNVYARLDGSAIRHRVVDDYLGESLSEATATQTDTPMTLGEFADFFLGAWPLIEALKSNFEDNLERSLDFFSAESEFYPDLDRLCRERVVEYFSAREDENDAQH